jgi:hypothetical protein
MKIHKITWQQFREVKWSTEVKLKCGAIAKIGEGASPELSKITCKECLKPICKSGHPINKNNGKIRIRSGIKSRTCLDCVKESNQKRYK